MAKSLQDRISALEKKMSVPGGKEVSLLGRIEAIEKKAHGMESSYNLLLDGVQRAVDGPQAFAKELGKVRSSMCVVRTEIKQVHLRITKICKFIGMK